MDTKTELKQPAVRNEAEHSVETVFYTIWSTPGFKRQVELVDKILGDLDDSMALLLLNYTVRNFCKIKLDRRDKFYYLIDRTLHLYSFREILGIRDPDVLDYACRYLRNKGHKDWDDLVFLEFISHCKPWLCCYFESTRVPEHLARQVLSRANIPGKNREALYKLFR